MNMLSKRIIEKDFQKIIKSLSNDQNFCETQEHIKEQLSKNYADNRGKSYTDKKLLARLQYLQNGLSLYQGFYISVIIGAIFFVLSLFLPSIIQITSNFEGKMMVHQYRLDNDTFYADGYNQGINHRKEDGEVGIIVYPGLDELNDQQAEQYFDGYNYAQNDGFEYSKFRFMPTMIIVFYLIGTIGIYYCLKLQQNNFNKYQTNDFEIKLIKKELGIAKSEVKHYKVKLKNQGKKVRATVDEVEFIKEI